MIAQITTAELHEKIGRGDRFTLVESMPEEYYPADLCVDEDFCGELTIPESRPY